MDNCVSFIHYPNFVVFLIAKSLWMGMTFFLRVNSRSVGGIEVHTFLTNIYCQTALQKVYIFPLVEKSYGWLLPIPNTVLTLILLQL